MFGIGPQEMIIVVLLIIVIFGPSKAASVARDLGRFANKARRPLDELKEGLSSVTAEEEPARKKEEVTYVKQESS